MKLIAISLLSSLLFGCASEAEPVADAGVTFRAFGYDVTAPMKLSNVPDVYSAYFTDQPIIIPDTCGGWMGVQDDGALRWAMKCNDGIHYGDITMSDDQTTGSGQIDGLDVTLKFACAGTPGINPECQ